MHVNISSLRCSATAPLEDFIENKIKKEWSRLLCRMEREELNIDELTRFLIHFDSRCAEMLTTEGTTTVTIKDIFEKLTFCQLWSFKEYKLLENIIEYTRGNLRPLLDEYVFKYHGHILAIKIANRLLHLEQQCGSEDFDEANNLPFTLEVSIKLAKNLQISHRMTQVSTDYVDELWKEGRHYHNIPPLTVVVQLIMHSNSLKHEDIDTPVSDVPDDEQSATEHQVSS